MAERLRLLAATLVALTLAACTGGAPPGATAPTGPAVASPTATAAATAPLLSPLAVTVAADGPPGTLAGLDRAPVIVEYPTSSTATGLVVISRTDAPAVGPLRRATGADAAAAMWFHAPLVTSLAPPAVIVTLRAAGLPVAEEGVPAGVVRRDPRRRAPDNAYALPAPARSALPTPADGAVVTRWSQGRAPATGGDRVAEVAVAATRAVTIAWTWDPRSGLWLRNTGDRIDQAADGGRVAADTVAVIEAGDDAGAPLDLTGAGPAVVLRAGRRYPARWIRDGAARPPSLEQLDGRDFPLGDRLWLLACPAPCVRQIAPRGAASPGM